MWYSKLKEKFVKEANIEFVGNAASDEPMVNPLLKQDLDSVSAKLGVTLSITTAKKGHSKNTTSGNVSRHMSYEAVDISKINGVDLGGKCYTTTQGKILGDMVAKELVAMGYSLNTESGKDKAVLWQTMVGGCHYNHLHVSRKKNSGDTDQSPTLNTSSSDCVKAKEILLHEHVDPRIANNYCLYNSNPLDDPMLKNLEQGALSSDNFSVVYFIGYANSAFQTLSARINNVVDCSAAALKELIHYGKMLGFDFINRDVQLFENIKDGFLRDHHVSDQNIIEHEKQQTAQSSDTVNEYALYIKRRNKRLSDSQAIAIATAVRKEASNASIDPRLIMAVIQIESDFNPNDTSKAGAMGLMQIMPDTARSLGVTNPYNIEQNIFGGVTELKQHLKAHNYDLILALAGYNAGEGNVRKYKGVPPFTETQNYVVKVPNTYRQLMTVLGL